MRRLQLVELHEHPWCPVVLRNGLTNFLEVAINTFDFYRPIRGHLQDALIDSGKSHVIDLCSGAGGPWVSWLVQKMVNVEVTLTDKFPNSETHRRIASLPDLNISYFKSSIDATAVPASLSGFRTLFSAFHHFNPKQAQAIIADAVSKSQPIGIFEYTKRSWKNIITMPITFAGVWLLTPRMHNLSWKTLLFTYPIPLIPLIITIDGIVSCLRTYTVEELKAMAVASHYVWRIGTAVDGRNAVTYLIGYPASSV